MNWTAIGATGELVGAFAVVITLIYLAISIRQNSKAISVAALRDVTAQWNQWSDMLASSSDLADVIARGNDDYGCLSPGEAMRYGAYIQSFFDNVESYRTLVTEYKLEKDLDVLQAIVRRRIAVSGFATWWEQNTEDYSESFVSWVEDIRRNG